MGDKNRITHEFSDGTFEKIMRDMDTGKIKKTENWFMDHPAYYGTSIQQKTAKRQNKCEKCPYFEEAEPGLKKVCKFPWMDPQDYDMAVAEFLPCKGKRG